MTLQFRAFVAYLLLAGAFVLVMTRLTLRDIRPQPLQATEDTLVETANLLAAQIERELSARDASAAAGGTSLDLPGFRATIEQALARPLEARIHEHVKRQMTLRVYVTDARGVVAYDSARQAQGQDYSRWRDVLLTLRGAYGSRATRSEPSDPLSSVHYVAAPVRLQGRLVAVVSVGKPVDSIKAYLQRTNARIATLGLLVLLAAALVAAALATWVTLPLRRLQGWASAVASGSRPAAPRFSVPELSAMARALESMRDALEGKRYVEGYVRSLTHEIKSPLSAIRASAELLGEDMGLEDRRRFLGNLRLEADRLQRLVDRMLELSALESRKSLEHVEAVAPADLVADIEQGFEPLLRRKGVSLVTEIAGAPEIRGDRLLLRQALANLVQNALQVTQAGGSIRLEVRGEGDRVVLRVSDTGPGVPDFALPRVFERFYTAPVGDRSEPGTGLGLPFVREVALLHGGDASLSNDPRGGAVATMWLSLSPIRH